jgi:hypothetical protein
VPPACEVSQAARQTTGLDDEQLRSLAELLLDESSALPHFATAGPRSLYRVVAALQQGAHQRQAAEGVSSRASDTPRWSDSHSRGPAGANRRRPPGVRFGGSGPLFR